MSEAKVIIKTANIKHRLKLLDALPIKYDVVVKSAYCKEWLLEIFKPRHLCFTEINKLGNRKDKTMLKIPNKNKMEKQSNSLIKFDQGNKEILECI